jgi:hypothetical protein
MAPKTPCRLVVGYDGSAGAVHALDAAARPIGRARATPGRSVDGAQRRLGLRRAVAAPGSAAAGGGHRPGSGRRPRRELPVLGLAGGLDPAQDRDAVVSPPHATVPVVLVHPREDREIAAEVRRQLAQEP